MLFNSKLTSLQGNSLIIYLYVLKKKLQMFYQKLLRDRIELE